MPTCLNKSLRPASPHFPALSRTPLRFPTLPYAFLRFPTLPYAFLRFPALPSHFAYTSLDKAHSPLLP